MALVKLDTVLYTVIRKSSSIFARFVSGYQLSFVANPLVTLSTKRSHLGVDSSTDRQLVYSERRARNVGHFAWHGNRNFYFYI
ncbi:hypothetical protein [Serratia liquefaciens]|uniref:hypothetical protein n=1 Tax=Serratia liquefaciens TaxID=614 RepID=UPI0021BCFFAE|nr:hypothetical protein [Serratia liquefaciens]